MLNIYVYVMLMSCARSSFINTANAMTGCLTVATLTGVAAISVAADIRDPVLAGFGIVVAGGYGFALQWHLRNIMRDTCNKRAARLHQHRARSLKKPDDLNL